MELVSAVLSDDDFRTDPVEKVGADVFAGSAPMEAEAAFTQ